MIEFEQEYFEEILLPSLRAVPLNCGTALKNILERTELRTTNNISLLDYGCGDGRFVKHAVSCGIDAWGVDISSYSKSVSVIPDRHGVLIEGKIPKDFGRSKYDLCFSCGVLQYMDEEQIKAFVSEIGSCCNTIWIETLTDCSNEVPAIGDSYNRKLRTREWYNKVIAGNGFNVHKVTPVYYRNGWLLEKFNKNK